MSSPSSHTAEIYRSVGARIRRERKIRHLTQDSLAAAVDLTRTSITQIERGSQKMMLHTFLAVAEALALSPADLLSDAEPVNSKLVEDQLPPGASQEIKTWVLSGISTAVRNAKP